jgi:hypothetical protein
MIKSGRQMITRCVDVDLGVKKREWCQDEVMVSRRGNGVKKGMIENICSNNMVVF